MADGQLDIVNTFVLTPTGETISAGAAARVKKSKAANTIRAYRADVAAFVKWCKDTGRNPLPASSADFTEYVSYLCDRDLAPSTIQRAIAAIRKLHEEAGHEDQPPAKLARDVLLGYKRTRAEEGRSRVKKATPISVDSLRRMIDTCDPNTLVGCRDHLLLVLGIGLMGRRSEIVALNMDDVTETERGLLVYIAVSKTDKAAEGEEVAIERGAFEGTDPVLAVRRWRDLLAVHGVVGGKLLRSVTKTGRIGEKLPPESVNDIVKDRAARAGLPNPDSYSAHSLRAGGMTAALRAGIPLGVAARHGRWKETSPVVVGYARTEDRWRDNAMRGVL